MPVPLILHSVVKQASGLFQAHKLQCYNDDIAVLKKVSYTLCMPYALCPMPYALCPMPISTSSFEERL